MENGKRGYKIKDLLCENESIYREMIGTRLETIYYCMHTRCYNKSHKSYRNYGKRGIKICDEWLGKNGKANFYKWAISHGYKEHLTIDSFNPHSRTGSDLVTALFGIRGTVSIHTPARGVTGRHAAKQT